MRRCAVGQRSRKKEAADDEPRGGAMILDATCAPADLVYTTDASLLVKILFGMKNSLYIIYHF